MSSPGHTSFLPFKLIKVTFLFLSITLWVLCIWEMQTCQHTAQIMPALHTTSQHWSVGHKTLSQQEGNLYITLSAHSYSCTWTCPCVAPPEINPITHTAEELHFYLPARLVSITTQTTISLFLIPTVVLLFYKLFNMQTKNMS